MHLLMFVISGRGLRAIIFAGTLVEAIQAFVWVGNYCWCCGSRMGHRGIFSVLPWRRVKGLRNKKMIGYCLCCLSMLTLDLWAFIVRFILPLLQECSFIRVLEGGDLKIGRSGVRWCNCINQRRRKYLANSVCKIQCSSNSRVL